MGGTGEEWFGGAGGVAFISSWNWAGDVPVWVFYNELPNTAKAVAEATSHEFGHAVGLSHDGVTGSAYYEGHGEGETGWPPIMGAAYHRNVTQWSRGEYEGANNRNNDIDTITHFINKIEFREDDHGQANEDATPLTIVDNVVTTSFHSCTVEDVSPPEVGPNVDVLLELFDADDDLVAESAPVESLSEQFVKFPTDELCPHSSTCGARMGPVIWNRLELRNDRFGIGVPEVFDGKRV